MSDVTKIRLPDNSELNIKDYRILGVDTEPISGSDNVVTSGGVYQAINDDALVISTAINDLNDRIETIEDDYVVTEAFDEIEGVVRDTYTKQEVDDLFSNYQPTETDPTVPAWAKALTKPSYTASEVGAQETLVSGTNIKTINSTSVLGSGNITTPDTKNTAGATDSSSKIYLVGATEQTANPQTYSNSNVFEQNGELTASKFNGPLEVTIDDSTTNTVLYKSVGAQRKVYTNVLGVANGSSPNNNTYANTSFYFLTVYPKSWDAQWTVKYKVNVHLDNESQQYKSSSTASVVNVGIHERGTYDCMFSGSSGTYSTYYFFQSQKNTSYRPIYYHMIHETTSAGFTAGCGHKIGVSLANSYLPTPTTDYSSGSAVANTRYPRTIEVVLDECINCTAELSDTLEIEGDAYRDDYTKLNTTYYPTNASASNSAGRWINLSATTQGLYESGDSDTYSYTQQSYNYLVNASKNGSTDLKLQGYSLFGFSKEGKALCISAYNSSFTSNTTGITQKGTRLYCTEGFDYTKGVRYTNSGSFFSANANMNISTAINYSAVDLRYSDNCVPATSANNLALIVRKPVYLRGTIGTDGLFYLAPIDVTYNSATYQRAWTQDIPTIENEDGAYVYWFIGYPYYNSNYPNALYQIDLITQGELVWYKDGSLKPYTVNPSDVPSAVSESTVAGWGFTKNSGTITGITMNNASKGTSGVVDLGTVITSHATHKLNATNGTASAVNQGTEITYVESVSGTTTATSGDLSVSTTRKKITVPTAVTESTVSGWGFTKNAGTLTTETDPVFSASPAAGITSSNISTWNGKQDAITFNTAYNSSSNKAATMADIPAAVTESTVSGWGFTKNTGTLTGVSFNGTNATVTNGVAAITATVPNITISSSEPTSSQGNNGDIWIVI